MKLFLLVKSKIKINSSLILTLLYDLGAHVSLLSWSEGVFDKVGCRYYLFIEWGFFKDAEIFLFRDSKYRLTQIFIQVLTDHSVQLKDDVFDYSYLYPFRFGFRFLSHVFKITSD